MDRRTFIAISAINTVLVARARAAVQKGKHRVGWLSPASAAEGVAALDALRVGLRELGYVEDRHFTVEARWADGRIERLPRLAAELVRIPVDIVCTAGSQASGAAKQATSIIPIVFANVAFPDKSGLVKSYARPGGNVTGVAFVGPEYGKRLELLKETEPKVSTVALIYNPESPGSVLALRETQQWTMAVGVTLEPYGLRGPHDIERMLSAIAGKMPHALMTTADPLIASYRVRIVEFAAQHRLLSMYPSRDFVDAGGLMFYGGSIPEMYRRTAVYVDRILKGARPGDLAVEQPTKFDMVINIRTAKALGITIPQSILIRADKVIE